MTIVCQLDSLLAERLGVDIFNDWDDDEDSNHEGRNFDGPHSRFLNYGVTDYGRGHLSAPDDPHVLVQPVLEYMDQDVASFMASERVHTYMAQLAGSSWPPADDIGIGRYRRVLAAAHNLIRTHFPHTE